MVGPRRWFVCRAGVGGCEGECPDRWASLLKAGFIKGPHHPTTKKRAPRSYFKLNPEENTIESCPILKRSTNSSQISFFVVRTVGTMRSQTKYDGFKCNQTMQRSYLISSSQLFIMDRVRKASEIHSPPPLLVPLPPPGSEWWDGKSWLAGHYSSVHTRTYTTQPINTY